MSKLESFEARHPQIAAWWTNSNFGFAVSLREQAARKGDLSEKQVSAAYRCIESFRRACEAKAEREATAPKASVDELKAAFDRARAAGLKRPRLTLQGFTITRAPDTGANAGALYVKDGGVYLGKFFGGVFSRSRDCDQDTAERLAAIANDPRAAALAHGKETGICAVCSRTLTDAQSVARGIGPICASKFGW